MTQKDLAEKLHVTEAAVSKWENGKGFPDIAMIEPLAESLGVSVGDLLKGEAGTSEEQHEEIVKDLLHISSETQKKDRRKTKVFQYLFAGVLVLSVIAAVMILPKVTVSKGDVYEQMFEHSGVNIQLPKGWTAKKDAASFKAASEDGNSLFWTETLKETIRLSDDTPFDADDDSWYKMFESLVSSEQSVSGGTVLQDTVSITQGKVDRIRSSTVYREYISSDKHQIFVREETMILYRGDGIVFIAVHPKNDEAAAREISYIRNHLKVNGYEITDDFNVTVTPVSVLDHHAEYKIRSDMDTDLIWKIVYTENGRETDSEEYEPVLLKANREYIVTVDTDETKNVYVIRMDGKTFYAKYHSLSSSWFDVRTMKTHWNESETTTDRPESFTFLEFAGENNNQGTITANFQAIPKRQIIKQ
jgi:transcriptional regulator with XRE-family HTH domain